jgi:hypothetical protein
MQQCCARHASKGFDMPDDQTTHGLAYALGLWPDTGAERITREEAGQTADRIKGEGPRVPLSTSLDWQDGWAVACERLALVLRIKGAGFWPSGCQASLVAALSLWQDTRNDPIAREEAGQTADHYRQRSEGVRVQPLASEDWLEGWEAACETLAMALRIRSAPCAPRLP